MIWKQNDYHEYVAFHPDQIKILPQDDVVRKDKGGVLSADDPEREANLSKFMADADPVLTDEKGQPKRFYHATYAKEPIISFNRMWSTNVRRPSMDTVGTWFSDNPSKEGGAGMYGSSEGASIYPMHLSAKKLKTYYKFDDFLRDMHEAEGRKFEDQNPKGIGSTEGLREKLKAQGYDGLHFPMNESFKLKEQIKQLESKSKQMEEVFHAEAKRRWDEGDEMPIREQWVYQKKIDAVIKNRRELEKKLGSIGSTEFGRQNVVVVFEPHQIKSPWNRGTYDPNEEDTHKAKGGMVHKDKGGEVDVDSIPAAPGTTPVKEDHVRLYHQTNGDSLREIEKHGLLLKHAKGIEGPRAIYAGETPFYGNALLRPTLEFQVPKDQWQPPFVLRDVKPEDFIAAHYPWHRHARYLEENNMVANVLSGKYDNVGEDEEKAVNYLKRKYAVKKATGGIVHKDKGGNVSLDAMRLALLNVPKMKDGGRKVSPIGFYSPAAEAAANLPQESGTPEQMGAMLAKNRGVTDEMQTSGYAQKMTTPKVSKQDLVGHFESEMPDVQETVLTRSPNEGVWIPEDSAEEYQPEPSQPAKYSGHTLPGGENYREVLLHLPALAKQYAYDAYNPQTQTSRQFNSRAEAEAFANKDETGQTVVSEIGVGKQDYRSSHWDEPNVLAHIRLNDRTDKDGKKVLFVEELQSDWAQEGRKKGFAGEGEKQIPVALQDTRNATRNTGEVFDRLIATGLSEQQANNHPDFLEAYNKEQAIKKTYGELTLRSKSNIPSAPFVDKTDKWLNLALKRITKMAVDGGYDKVAFVNGDQSADRYDLSKKVKDIAYFAPSGKAADKFGTVLKAFDHNNEQVINKIVTPEELPNYVGKDVAEKLLSQPKGKMGEVTLSSLDLKIGGEGMKAFYDQIVPAAVNKLLPRIKGKKLETVHLVNQAHDFDPDELENATPEELAQLEAGGVSLHQSGFEITPEMREHVKKGLPIFKKGGTMKGYAAGGTAKGTTMPTLAQMKMALMKPNDVSSIGAQEAPSMSPKAYFSPDKNSPYGQMPIGGVDLSMSQQGQQLMAQQPQQPPQQPQGGPQPQGAPQPPEGGLPQPPQAPQGPQSNMLEMTPQGQMMGAMTPVRKATGGGISGQGNMMLNIPLNVGSGVSGSVTGPQGPQSATGSTPSPFGQINSLAPSMGQKLAPANNLTPNPSAPIDRAQTLPAYLNIPQNKIAAPSSGPQVVSQSSMYNPKDSFVGTRYAGTGGPGMFNPQNQFSQENYDKQRSEIEKTGTWQQKKEFDIGQEAGAYRGAQTKSFFSPDQQYIESENDYQRYLNDPKNYVPSWVQKAASGGSIQYPTIDPAVLENEDDEPSLFRATGMNEGGSMKFAIQPAKETAKTPENFTPYDDSNPSIKKLTTAFNEAIAHHLSLSQEDRVANSQRAANAVAKHIGRTSNNKPKDLLGKNAKLIKSEKGEEEAIKLPDGRGIETTGLALSPAYQEKQFQTCPNHAACKAECLGKTSGNYFKLGGGQDLEEFKGPRLNSLLKTQAFLRDPHSFAVKLHDEIQAAKDMAAANNNHLGVRLNVLSDIAPAVHESIIKAHPDVTFYDYTKNKSNPIAPNHHYTYSSTGATQPGVENPNTNWKQMRKRLDNGDNVAMAFSHKEHLPQEIHDQETGKLYKVIDGDSHDFRPLDIQPEGSNGVIVGLKNKKATGKVSDAHKDSKGFFVHYDPQLKMNPNGTYERSSVPRLTKEGKPKIGETIPQNRRVNIIPQEKVAETFNNDGEKE